MNTEIRSENKTNFNQMYELNNPFLQGIMIQNLFIF